MLNDILYEKQYSYFYVQEQILSIGYADLVQFPFLSY